MTTAAKLVARIARARADREMRPDDHPLALTLANAEAALDRGSVDLATALVDVVEDELARYAGWRDEAEEAEALRRQGLDVL